MSHTSPEAAREANLLGACALAVAGRLPAAAGQAALVALHTFLGGASIDAVARVLGLTHSGAVRLVDRLERSGLVERRAGADGRSVAVGLTRAGVREAARLQSERQRTLLEVLAPLDAPDRARLATLLEAVLGGLVADREVARRICRLCDVDACGHPDRCPVTQAMH